MAHDGITELAMLLKSRDNKPTPSPGIGVVLSIGPDPRIRLNEYIILDREQLVFSQQLANSMLVGDEVILIPVTDGQLYFAIDKAVKY